MNELLIAKLLRLIVVGCVLFVVIKVALHVFSPERKALQMKLAEQQQKQLELDDELARSTVKILKRRAAERVAGREWAKLNHATHAQCKAFWKPEANNIGHNIYQRSACHDYVFTQNMKAVINFPRKAADWGDNATTSECREKTALFIHTYNENKLQMGDRAMTPRTQRGYFAECNTLDFKRINHMLIDPLTRLRLILKKYHNGMLIAEEDKKIIRQDYAQVYNYMPNNEHKAQYLKEVEKLFTLFGGREHVLLESNVTIQKSDRIQYR